MLNLILVVSSLVLTVITIAGAWVIQSLDLIDKLTNIAIFIMTLCLIATGVIMCIAIWNFGKVVKQGSRAAGFVSFVNGGILTVHLALVFLSLCSFVGLNAPFGNFSIDSWGGVYITRDWILWVSIAVIFLNEILILAVLEFISNHYEKIKKQILDEIETSETDEDIIVTHKSEINGVKGEEIEVISPEDEKCPERVSLVESRESSSRASYTRDMTKIEK